MTKERAVAIAALSAPQQGVRKFVCESKGCPREGAVKEFRNWSPILLGEKVWQATPACILCDREMKEVG